MPPYNIVKTGRDAYRITLAVAGFGDDELDLVVQENLLTVRGKANDAEAEERPFTCTGALPGARSSIASSWPTTSRSPARSWSTACSTSSWCAKVPEAMKPQKISIGQAAAEPRVIEGKKTAA